MLTLLINHHATHVTMDDHGNTMFIIAAAHDNEDLLNTICTPFYKNSKFDINTPNKNGDTALIEAARRGFLKTVTLLLDNGANVLHSNLAGRTALHEAAAEGHQDVLSALQSAEASLPKVYPYADAALKLLATVPVVSRFLPNRVPVRTPEFDRDGNSPAMLAAENGREDLLHALINPQVRPRHDRLPDEDDEDSEGSVSLSSRDSGALTPFSPPMPIDIDQKNREGMNALCLAARNGHYATAELLINNGAKVHGTLVSDSGNVHDVITPLWLAARLTECARADGSPSSDNQVHHSPELLVDMFLKHGAIVDLNRPSWQGQTPLIAAAGAGRVAIVKVLLDAGAKVNQPDIHKLTPLMHAAHHGHVEVAQALLINGAQPDPRPGKLSALILAAEGGHDMVMKLLISRGANINQADSIGATALMGAARGGNTSTAKLLITLGANLNQTDRSGRTALDYATRAGHHDIRRLLEQGSPAPRDY
jgi:ankyrin repeat protein